MEEKKEKSFDLRKFLYDVFDPQPGEIVLFLVDLPHSILPGHAVSYCPDTEEWKERRKMAKEWWMEMKEIAEKRHFEVLPIVYYSATGQPSAPLPEEIVRQVKNATLVLAMTEFSATGPLGRLTKIEPYLRVASMPGILKRMEKSALAADYAEVQRRCKIVADLMGKANFCDVEFDYRGNIYQCRFDLRFRKMEIDDGYLHVDKKGMQLINLPSGEVCPAPYEGEKEGIKSQTKGKLPIYDPKFNSLVIFKVEENKIVEVSGNDVSVDGPVVWWREYFSADDARRNIAECAFGVNPRAVVTGNTLEDEKAGFHWAYGLSSHLGGVWGPEKFKSEKTQVHQDFVYAKGNPIQVKSAILIHYGIHGIGLDLEEHKAEIIRDGEYVIFKE